VYTRMLLWWKALASSGSYLVDDTFLFRMRGQHAGKSGRLHQGAVGERPLEALARAFVLHVIANVAVDSQDAASVNELHDNINCFSLGRTD
jgi:hypothetical protein